mmetsp:Transcript_47354/g.150903  ORF Transcript_47354/g.150903 Transcript_47354/m.150903 type:complete len:95 (-) Transcript_47354:832-1116(-)
MSDDLGPCGDPAQDEDEESAVAWRRLRDIFEEDGLTDHSAEGHIFESACDWSRCPGWPRAAWGTPRPPRRRRSWAAGPRRAAPRARRCGTAAWS